VSNRHLVGRSGWCVRSKITPITECVCVHIYVYIYIHLYIHIYMYMYICVGVMALYSTLFLGVVRYIGLAFTSNSHVIHESHDMHPTWPPPSHSISLSLVTTPFFRIKTATTRCPLRCSTRPLLLHTTKSISQLTPRARSATWHYTLRLSPRPLTRVTPRLNYCRANTRHSFSSTFFVLTHASLPRAC